MNGRLAALDDRDSRALNARTNITNIRGPRATANYSPSRFTWLNSRAIGTQYNSSVSTELAGGDAAPGARRPARAVSSPPKASPFRDVGHVHRRRALRDRLYLTAAVVGSEQRVRHEVRRLLSQGEPLMGDFRRGILPAQHVQRDQQHAPPLARARRAFGPNDALRTFRRLGQHQEHRCADRDLQAVGNDGLRPRQSTEWETGSTRSYSAIGSVRRHVLLG